MIVKKGWAPISAESMTEFHRELVVAIPKYAAVAVSQLMLPGSVDALPPDEREAVLDHRRRQKRATAAAKQEPNKAPPTDYAAIGAKKDAEETVRRLIATPPIRRVRPWHVEDWCAGKAGETRVLMADPGCLFRVENMHVTDSRGGNATKIGDIFVGTRLQKTSFASPSLRPVYVLTRTAEERLRAASGLLSSGWRFDTCQPGIAITMSVYFIGDAVFHYLLIGSAAPA